MSRSPQSPPDSPHSGNSRASRSDPGRSMLSLQGKGRTERGDSNLPAYTYRNRSQIFTVIPPALSRSFQGFHRTPVFPPQPPRRCWRAQTSLSKALTQSLAHSRYSEQFTQQIPFIHPTIFIVPSTVRGTGDTAEEKCRQDLSSFGAYTLVG